MKTFNYVIKDELGLHARPAGRMVKLVKAMSSKVWLTAGDRKADLTKMFAIMDLGVKQGNEISVTAEGENEAADIEVLERFFHENF